MPIMFFSNKENKNVCSFNYIIFIYFVYSINHILTRNPLYNKLKMLESLS